MDDREAYIAFNLLRGIGPVRVRTLIEFFGSAPAALRASEKDLLQVKGIGRDLARVVHTWQESIDLGAELQKIRDRGISIVIPPDGSYPRLLREIYDPPLVLYVWGELSPLDHTAIAIVGSRRATHYGIKTARMISFQLAQAGITVASGLARGIDTSAHEGALASGGRTVAVIGSGLGKLFPAENQGLAERIADGHGAVISEFPVDYPPDKQSFPLRNRIVSGWSSGVLVVEAPGRSGALITAEQAGEQGRPVYAIPGPIDRPASQGCNRLIQDGARLVMDGQDILDDLGDMFITPPMSCPTPENNPTSATPPSSAASLPPLNEDEASVLEAVPQGEEALVDTIVRDSGLPASTVLTVLMRLEMKRLVSQLPGPRYVRT